MWNPTADSDDLPPMPTPLATFTGYDMSLYDGYDMTRLPDLMGVHDLVAMAGMEQDARPAARVPSSVNERAVSNRVADTSCLLPQRTAHNAMERERRVNLRKCFEGLRGAMPHLAQDAKAPALHILNEAVSFIARLQAEDMELTAGIARLTQQNASLRTAMHQRRFQALHEHDVVPSSSTPASA